MIVWLASYPRSGNTLLRTVLKQTMGLDSYPERTEWLGFIAQGTTGDLSSCYYGELCPSEPWEVFYQKAKESPELYLVKTHEAPLDDSPAIYVMRDGRKACFSYYRYHQSYLQDLGRTLLQIVVGDDYYGDWTSHYHTWKSRQLGAPLLVLKYEDLHDASPELLGKIKTFLKRDIAPGHWENPFEKVQQLNPQCFREGEKQWMNPAEWSDEVAWAFSLFHAPLMKKLGYAPDPVTQCQEDEGKERAVKILSMLKSGLDERRCIPRPMEESVRLREALELKTTVASRKTQREREAFCAKGSVFNISSSSQQLNAAEGSYEQDTDMALLKALARHVRKKTFIDVGAEKGSFSQELINLGFSGTLFEPFPAHQVALEKLVAGKSSHVFQMAIDETDHEGRLHIAVDEKGMPMDYFHSLNRDESNPHARHASSISVTCRSLGSLTKEGIIAAEVGILKIDTEGNDLKVIRGMGSLTADVLFCEFVTPSLYPSWECSFPDALMEAARRIGYEECIAVKRFGAQEMVSVNPAKFVDGQWGNLIFTSRELMMLAQEEISDIKLRDEIKTAADLARAQRSLEEKEREIQSLAKACEDRLALIHELTEAVRKNSDREKELEGIIASLKLKK
ncbi:hypothetical protein BH11VER1_BH11VER1_00420 [soil metagenome]